MIMKVSDRTKCNIYLALTLLGVAVFVARVTDAVLSAGPVSGRQWLGIVGALVITWCVSDSWLGYRRRVRRK